MQETLPKDNTVEWYTPKYLVAMIQAFFGEIDLDPCADPEHRIPATYHFTSNGLSGNWRGRVYMNPPYGRVIQHWVEKALHAPTTETIMLLPARPGSRWFQKQSGCAMIFIRGRVKFDLGDAAKAKNGGTTVGKFDSVLVYRGTRRAEFIDAFAQLGCAMQSVGTEIAA